MAVDLNALDEHAQALWARVLTTAQAAGESVSEARAIAERGLTNAGLIPGAKAKSFAERTKDGLRLSMPIVAVTKGGTSGKRRVFGFGSVAVDADGVLVIDHQDDIIEPSELEEGVYDFAKNARKADIQHDRKPIGDLIESAYLDPRKRVAMDGDGSGRVGWWAGFEVSDDVAARVERGELNEFSIDVLAHRVTGLDGSSLSAKSKARERVAKGEVGRLRNLQIRLLSLVDAGAGKGVSIELVKARESEPMKIEDLKAALAALSPEERSSLLTTETPKVDGAETPAAKALAEQLKSRDEIQKRLEQEVETLKARESEREEISKAREGGCDGLVGLTIEEHAKARVIIRKADAELAKRFEQAEKAWAESIKKGSITKSVGSNGSANAAGSFEELYEAEKKANPKEPAAEIAKRLARDNPELYAAHRARS